MNMCQVTGKNMLPKLWQEVAIANGKCYRKAIKAVLCNITNHNHQPKMAPVVTPALAKKITSVRLAGTNLDNLSKGINPFVIPVQVHTTAEGSNAYNEALIAVTNYDDLMHRNGTADLQDLKVLKSTTKVLIPETYALVRAMLQAFGYLEGAFG